MNIKSKLLIVVFTASNSLMNFTYAQNADDLDSNVFSIDEIIVTSRKRGEESLQDIPATITAFDSSELAIMQVADFSDFAYQVPGLTFTDEGPGEKRYIVRGIQSGGQQQVAVYYDEVPHHSKLRPAVDRQTGCL